ncbi:hypothetical protein GP486_004777 [Trichoglossum hirsutum]|uniref:Uncharacterized protein n=1 Tax=Trichoglossum hirsutum TaxID=265104 RepID=A0A9P8LAI9_9PEZI|nr:hypothetical protein GP486_004777 [Trichoglossum hirsutum]
MSQSSIILRPPNKPSSNADWKPPPVDWLEGTWHVTHSTLSLWKTKKNVRITYKALPPFGGSTSSAHRLDDTVSYQWLNSESYQWLKSIQWLSSDAVKTVHGIDTSSEGGDTSSWDWRGTGWLFFVTSHWEFLGWGGGDSSEDVSPGEDSSTSALPAGGDWAVTYFAKTLFTPAGIDVYSRSEAGLSSAKVAEIRAALAEVDDEDVRKLAGEIFEIARDAP